MEIQPIISQTELTNNSQAFEILNNNVISDEITTSVDKITLECMIPRSIYQKYLSSIIKNKNQQVKDSSVSIESTIDYILKVATVLVNNIQSENDDPPPFGLKVSATFAAFAAAVTQYTESGEFIPSFDINSTGYIDIIERDGIDIHSDEDIEDIEDA
jgi:hypothetical protein